MALSVDIEKKVGSFSLKIKFEVENETLALFGASGCGKSMTLKCIAGIEKPDRGRIVLDGKVLFDSEKHINLKPQKRAAGYLFQQYALFPNMTVEQNIACGMRAKQGRDKSKIAEMIRAMHLEGLEKHKPSQLSGGQQQRVALARILINEPDVLLLDEPFSALDTHLRFQMEQEVKEVIKRFGKTVIFVSHDRDEVYRLSDRIVVMYDGYVEISGTKSEIFASPRTLNGARLTGYRNISRVRVIDENTVYAEDWGAQLKVQGSTEGITHIGIRTKEVKLYETENTVRCRISEIIANPFTYTIMVSPVSGNGDATFSLLASKTRCDLEEGSELLVSLPQENIVLLRETMRE